MRWNFREYHATNRGQQQNVDKPSPLQGGTVDAIYHLRQYHGMAAQEEEDSTETNEASQPRAAEKGSHHLPSSIAPQKEAEDVQ